MREAQDKQDNRTRGRKRGGRMISRQILQNTLDGNKEISGADLCLTDLRGMVLAATYEPEADELTLLVLAFAESEAESREMYGRKFFKVMDGENPEYVLVVVLEKKADDSVGKMVVFQLQSLLTAYQDRSDRDSFIKNLILDNLLLVDISNRARKLHIEARRRRVVYLIEAPEGMYCRVLEQLRNLFASRNGDFITAVDEKRIILVKELEINEDFTGIEKTATVIKGMFRRNAEQMRISFGTVVNELREVSRSYKEARMALEVGRIFYNEREIIPYSTLGIGRLIYQLPMSLCELFTKEIFGDTRPDDLGEELMTTISKFFECSLNVSETARQLFIHRNTLVYRLDKVYKITGLDLRTFEGAIAFKIGLMVLNYMKETETEEY